MASQILILDDEKNYLLILEAMLGDAGYAVTALDDPETGLAFLDESEVDVVITDMKMPRVTGQQVLEHVKRNYPYIPVIIMTAFGSIEGAVEAMRIGAFDYIAKPFANDELLLTVEKASRFAAAQRENMLLRQSLEDRFSAEHIIGRGKAMQRVLEMVGKAAPDPVHGAGDRRIRHGQGARGQGHPLRLAGAKTRPSCPSTAWPWPRACSNPSCSATRRDRSPGR